MMNLRDKSIINLKSYSIGNQQLWYLSCHCSLYFVDIQRLLKQTNLSAGQIVIVILADGDPVPEGSANGVHVPKT